MKGHMTKRYLPGRFLAVAVFGLAGCGSGSGRAAVDSGVDGADANGPGAANPFYPQDLADAITALQTALGDQPQAGDVRVTIITNGCASNFWNQAQIGSARAANSIGCVATFECPAGTTAAERSASQISIVNQRAAEGVAGIAVTNVDPMGIEPALMAANSAGVNIMTFDSDGIPGSVRKLYVGTINETAGRAAGQAMIDTLGTAGGQIVTTGGYATASNAVERIAGINAVLTGTNVHVMTSDFDDLDPARARMNVQNEIMMYPSLAGFIGIYAQNGPIILNELTTKNLLGRYKIVAFDLDPATLRGIRAGNIAAAIGQRPYWWGYLSVYILYAMKQLGPTRTMQILAPHLSGTNNDIFNTGQDVVRPETFSLYQQYLNSIGINGS